MTKRILDRARREIEEGNLWRAKEILQGAIRNESYPNRNCIHCAAGVAAKRFGIVCFSLCDPFVAAFIGLTAVITAEAPRTAEIAEKTFEAKPRRDAIQRACVATLEKGWTGSTS